MSGCSDLNKDNQEVKTMRKANKNLYLVRTRASSIQKTASFKQNSDLPSVPNKSETKPREKLS